MTRRRRPAASVAVVVVAALTATGCGSSRPRAATPGSANPGSSTTAAPAPTTGAAPTTGTAPTTTLPGPTTTAAPTTTAPATTTTTAVPVAPQPEAQMAATALVDAWSTDNRPVALSVATTRAVDTLLAVPYPGYDAILRQCNTTFTPITCTYGPNGGASPTLPIYQLSLAHVAKGWYVRSVQIER